MSNELPRRGRRSVGGARDRRSLTEVRRPPRTEPRLGSPLSPRSRESSSRGRGGLTILTVASGEPPEHLFRSLLGAYLAGSDEFRISLPTGEEESAAREVVRTFCRRTRQPEIVSDDRGWLCLRDTSVERPDQLPVLLRRMGRRVVAIHREAVGSWSRLSLGDEARWDREDDGIDRDAWQIQRWAVRQLGPPVASRAVPGLLTVARSLERIADHAIVLGATGARFADLPDAAGAATSLRQFHDQAMTHLEAVLSTADPGDANDLLDVGEALELSGRVLSDRLLSPMGHSLRSPAASVAIARVLESIGRTIAYTQDIAQVLLDEPMTREAVPRAMKARAPPPRSPPVPAA